MRFHTTHHIYKFALRKKSVWKYFFPREISSAAPSIAHSESWLNLTPPSYVDSSTMRKIQKIQLRWRSPSPQFAWLNIPHRVETYTIAHSTGLALAVNFYAYNHHFKLDYITSSFRDHCTRLSLLARKRLRTGLQCNFVGLDRSKTILTGISSLPHQLKLAMPPIFLLFVVPHQQEQVHPDKSLACGVVGVQPNLRRRA